MQRFVLITTLIVATAANTCNNGLAPGSNGCCADTNQCPLCCLYKSESSSGSDTVCTCDGCDGATVQYDAQCTASGCSTYCQGLGYPSFGPGSCSGISFGSCNMCVGPMICSTDPSTLSNCLSVSPDAGSVSGTLYTCGHGAPSNPCFPSSARVTLTNGSTVRMDELEHGDEMIALTADGVVDVGTVSSLSIAEHKTKRTFVKLTSVTGRVITLTGTHHLPFGNKCCRTLTTANDIQVGDTIWVVGSKQTIHAEIIARKDSVVDRGLHSPVLTNGHLPIVEGIVTAFDTMDRMILASYGLPLLETMSGLVNKVIMSWVGDPTRWYMR